jgi:hypothetical protein
MRSTVSGRDPSCLALRRADISVLEDLDNYKGFGGGAVTAASRRREGGSPLYVHQPKAGARGNCFASAALVAV